jgi:hypothetical protein
MRRRLEKYLPIVLIALMVQILAPIGACWAAAIAASDPLKAAEICHTDGGSGSADNDQSGQHRAHDGICAICCVMHASAALDTPQISAVVVPHLESSAVSWREQAPGPSGSRTGSNAQARAPPPIA